MFDAILKKLKAPITALDALAQKKVADAAAIGARAALAEAPLLDALLDGETVTLEITMRLKK